MKTILLSALSLLLLSGNLAHAKLSCPSSYIAITCTNKKIGMDGYEKIAQVKNDKFLFCVGPNSPKYLLVSEQPLDARLGKVLNGADDSMFGRNGFGAFTDKNEKAAVVFVPLTDTVWRLFISGSDSNGPPDSASEYNCVK